MKCINKLAWTFSLCVILFTAANFARADFWRWTRPFRGPYQKIQTLIVTGNYSESRLLAELIQVANRQPILLMPAVNDKNIYFMPPQKSSEALQVPRDELTNFVNFLGAKQIIILGDPNYVPDKYAEKITSNQVIWRITGNNWKNIATSIGKFLNLTNLSDDYDTLLDKMKSEINYERTGEKTSQPNLMESESFEIIPVEDDGAVVKNQPEIEPIELIDASAK
jgi:hypothetical protein